MTLHSRRAIYFEANVFNGDGKYALANLSEFHHKLNHIEVQQILKFKGQEFVSSRFETAVVTVSSRIEIWFILVFSF